MRIKLIKFKENLIKPTRAHYNDAGLDCYAQEDIRLTPEIDTTTYEHEDNGTCLTFSQVSHKTHKIPLGFGLEIPNGYVGFIKARSSMNLKSILTHEGTIDSGYRGEISAVLTNLSSDTICINKGDKICQIVIMPVAICDFVEDLGEERKDGGFGSTGK